MDKTKLVISALPWALISVVLASFGAPPAILTLAHTVYQYLPDIINIGGSIGAAGIAAWQTLKAKTPPAASNPAPQDTIGGASGD